MRTPVAVGVIGNSSSVEGVARSFHDLPQAELRWVCCIDVESPAELKPRFPTARIAAGIEDVLEDESLDAIAVTTSPSTHYDLAMRILDADKHVLIAGPLALRSDHCDDLLRRADETGRRLVVIDRLLHDVSIIRLQRLIKDGSLGEIYYATWSRNVFPPASFDGNLVWGPGAEMISTLLHLIGDEPVELSAIGDSYVRPGGDDVLLCHLRFATGITARIDLSRLERQRRNTLTFVGALRTATIDFRESERRLAVREPNGGGRFDRRQGASEAENDLGATVSYRLPTGNAMQSVCKAFLQSVRSKTSGPSNSRFAAGVVDVLTAVDRSLEARRAATPIAVQAPPSSSSSVIQLDSRQPARNTMSSG